MKIFVNNTPRTDNDFFKLEVSKHIEKDECVYYVPEYRLWQIKPIYE